LLSEQFTDLRVFKFTEPACQQFKQIVVLATRRKRHARLSDAALSDGVRYLEMLSTKAALEPMGNTADVRYEVPTSEPIVLTNMGIPLDEVEDLLLESPAYRQAGRVLVPKLGDVKGRPLTPLHGAVEALERQEPFVNQTLAYHALAMLAQLFRYGRLLYHGGFVNLRAGRTTSLPVGL
jgi:hypothetical protein